MPLMWWWRSTWTYPRWMEVVHRDGRLYIGHAAGGIRFHGGGGGPDLWWSEQTARFRTLGQFVLGTDRMTPRSLFASNPHAELSGILQGYSGSSALFDNPSLRCTLHLRQTAYLGDVRVASSRTSEDLIRIRDRADVFRQRRLELARFRFQTVHVYLDGTRSLTIDLELELDMRHEDEGWFRFLPNEEEWEGRFYVRVPQWEVRDVAETLI